MTQQDFDIKDLDLSRIMEEIEDFLSKPNKCLRLRIPKAPEPQNPIDDDISAQPAHDSNK